MSTFHAADECTLRFPLSFSCGSVQGLMCSSCVGRMLEGIKVYSAGVFRETEIRCLGFWDVGRVLPLRFKSELYIQGVRSYEVTILQMCTLINQTLTAVTRVNGTADGGDAYHNDGLIFFHDSI